MKVYEMFTQADDYENLELIGGCNLEFIQSFDGRSKINEWTPVAFKPMEGKLPWDDIASFTGNVPVVTQRVIKATEDLLKDYTEVLPILCPDQEMYILNVLGQVDCIDYDKAKAVLFKSSGRVMYFSKHAFLEEKLKGKHIFRLKEFPHSTLYVSDEFKKRIEDNNLLGFKFELVWDSEAAD